MKREKSGKPLLAPFVKYVRVTPNQCDAHLDQTPRQRKQNAVIFSTFNARSERVLPRRLQLDQLRPQQVQHVLV